jgi:hypothetical protein
MRFFETSQIPETVTLVLAAGAYRVFLQSVSRPALAP